MKLKYLRKIYNLIKNDKTRSYVLAALERFNIRKDIVRLDTNDICNIECIMCNNRPKKCNSEHFIPFDDFMKLIDKIAETAKLLYLSCSYEPLVTPRFSDYLIYAKEKRIPFISFATNGLLLTEDLGRVLVDKNINELILSFNGYSREDYNRIMYRSNYDIVMKNLSRLMDYKKVKNSPFPCIRVNTMLMKTNLRNIDLFIEMLREYQVDCVQFRKFDNKGVNNPEAVKCEELTPFDLLEMRPFIRRLQEEVHHLVDQGKEVIIPLGFQDEDKLTEKRNIGLKGSCPIPFFSYWIDFRGELKICCGENEGAIIGNLLTDSTEEIRKKRASFRKLALSGRCLANCTTSNLFDSTIA